MSMMVTTLFLSMMLSLVASVLSPFFVELVSVIMMLVMTVLIPLMMATLFVAFHAVVSLAKISLVGHFALLFNLIGFLSSSWLFWNGVLLVIFGFSCGLWNWHCHGQLNQTDTGQRNQQQHLHLGTLSTPSEGVYAKKFSNPFSNPNSH